MKDDLKNVSEVWVVWWEKISKLGKTLGEIQVDDMYIRDMVDANFGILNLRCGCIQDTSQLVWDVSQLMVEKFNTPSILGHCNWTNRLVL